MITFNPSTVSLLKCSFFKCKDIFPVFLHFHWFHCFVRTEKSDHIHEMLFKTLAHAAWFTLLKVFDTLIKYIAFTIKLSPSSKAQLIRIENTNCHSNLHKRWPFTWTIKAWSILIWNMYIYFFFLHKKIQLCDL